MFALAVFEAIEVKGCRMVKKWDIEAERKIQINVKNQISNFVFISYSHFPARNGSKSTITTWISEYVNNFLVDF
jgi:hypothetical protein